MKYCRYGFSRICSTVSRSLIPNFSLIINAPNAIRKDLAGAPFSVGKFLAYSVSNSDHGISSAIFTQRLSGDNFPHEGSSKSEGEAVASSAFLYTFAGGDARVLDRKSGSAGMPRSTPFPYTTLFRSRLSGDNFPHEGSSKSEGEAVASSAFLYTFAGGDARVLTYFTCLSCTFFSISPSKTQTTQYGSNYSANPRYSAIARLTTTRASWGTVKNSFS